jgi:hypothetical protein
MFLDIDAQLRDLTAGSGSADPLPEALESILETGAHQLSAEMDPGKMLAQARLRDGAAIDIDAAIPVSLLTGTLDAIEALGRDTGNAERTFRQDIRRQIYDVQHAPIGGEIGGPGLYPNMAEGLLAGHTDDVHKVRALRTELAAIDQQLSSKGVLSNEERERLATAGNELRLQIDALVSSLEEAASQRLLSDVALQTSRDAAILQTLFTQAGQSFLRLALDATLSEHAIRDEDRLQITPEQWLRDLKPTVRVGRREHGRRADEPYAIDVTLSLEGTLSELGYIDGKGRQQTLSLRPGSKVEMQVKAELKLGKLRPVSSIVRAHLDPVPPVEKNRPRPPATGRGGLPHAAGTASGSIPPKRPSQSARVSQPIGTVARSKPAAQFDRVMRDLTAMVRARKFGADPSRRGLSDLLRQAIAQLPQLPPPRRLQAFRQVLDLLGQSSLIQESDFMAGCTSAIAYLSFEEWPQAIAAAMHASGGISHQSDRERFWDSLNDLLAEGARRIWQMPEAGDPDVLRHLIEALRVLPNEQARNAYRSIVVPAKGLADTPLARGIEAGIKDKLFG